MGFFGNRKKKTDQIEHISIMNHEDMVDEIKKGDNTKEQPVSFSVSTQDHTALHHHKKKGLELSDFKNYVQNQCERMEIATSYMERTLLEYDNVTQYVSDVQVIESLPKQMRDEIAESAMKIDNLTTDRLKMRSTNAKLPIASYSRLEQLQDELPKGIVYMQKQESYYESVKHDVRILEGERMGLRMEAKALANRQLKIKSASVFSVCCLAAIFMIFIAILVSGTDNTTQVQSMFLFVVCFGTILALGMFAYLKYTEREVLVTENKLNKAINLLNKMKIKYINAANTLDYEHNKYRVNSVYELEKKYEAYLEMKKEQIKISEVTKALDEAEKELNTLLISSGIGLPQLWTGQATALYKERDLDSLKERLFKQRKKLKEQLEYNQKEIENAKQNIKNIIVIYPDYTDIAMKLIDGFENKQV